MGWRSKDETVRPDREPIENVLGRSAFIRGELSAEGPFRIDGTVEGTVASRAEIVIGESGVVRGDVIGTDVVVAGEIVGNVRCSGHLEILAKGKVEGDIAALSVRIETGGVFRGTSFMGASNNTPKHRSVEAEGEPQLDSRGHLVPAA
jgi:cytoskeletal protein CcmA (bactofilin family)